MIEEVYVSLEVARLLREKRFDETCRAYWGGFIDKPLYLCECNRGKFFDYCRNSWLKVNVCDDEQDYMAAPTQQMVMKWLRKVYHIHTEICLYKTNEGDIEPKKSRKAPYYTFGVWDTVTGNNVDKRLTNDFIGDSYEEACETAIKYCLEHLI